MANEDFTTFTEVDTHGVLSETSARVTANGAVNFDNMYLYKDKGAAFFAAGANFRHNLDVNFVSGLPDGTWEWLISNDLGSVNQLNTGNKPYMAIGQWDWNGGTSKYNFILYSQPSFQYGAFIYSLNTFYYLQIYYDKDVGTYGTMYLDVYPTDADRTAGTNKLEALSLALPSLMSAFSFKYLYGFAGYAGTGGGGTDVIYSENMNLSAVAPPTASVKNKPNLLLLGAG